MTQRKKSSSGKEYAPWVNPETGMTFRRLTEQEKGMCNENTFPRRAPWEKDNPNRARCLAALQSAKPQKYKTAEELAAKVDEYFAWCETREIETRDKKTGDPVKYVKQRPYTLAGLSAYLGFASTSGFTQQTNLGDDFAFVVEYARAVIEAFLSEKLIDHSGIPGGIIFALKNNHGWSDQTQVHVSGDVRVGVGLAMMPPEPKNMLEWQEWYKEVMSTRAMEREKESIDITPERRQLPATKEADNAEE